MLPHTSDRALALHTEYTDQIFTPYAVSCHSDCLHLGVSCRIPEQLRKVVGSGDDFSSADNDALPGFHLFISLMGLIRASFMNFSSSVRGDFKLSASPINIILLLQ